MCFFFGWKFTRWPFFGVTKEMWIDANSIDGEKCAPPSWFFVSFIIIGGRECQKKIHRTQYYFRQFHFITTLCLVKNIYSR